MQVFEQIKVKIQSEIRLGSYMFFDDVVRGESMLFRLVVRNGFAHFVRKVFARRKLLPGKFWVFVPLLFRLKGGDGCPTWSKNCLLGDRFTRTSLSCTDFKLSSQGNPTEPMVLGY